MLIRLPTLMLTGFLMLASAGAVPQSYGITDQIQEPAAPSSGTAALKPVGVVKAISGNTITLATDTGPIINIMVQDSTRLLRISPGQKDLKDAAAIQLQDVQVGDRILARGKPSDDGKSVEASSVVVMKESDVAAKQEHDREDWQKRGVGGLVSKVDAASGTITLAAPVIGDAKPISIHVSKSTVIRRY